MMIRFIIILTFIQFFSPIYSQVNTEKFRKEFKKSGFYGKMSLAAGLAKGNSEFVKVKSSSFFADFSLGPNALSVSHFCKLKPTQRIRSGSG